jgi:hypothetical protein
MDDRLKSRILARLQVQEAVTAFLMAPFLKGLSHQQRAELEQLLSEPPSVNELPPEFQNLGIDAADKLAGYAMDYKAAMRRAFREAWKKADSL